MKGGLKPKSTNPKKDHIEKRRNQWNLDSKDDNKIIKSKNKKNELKKNILNEKNNTLSGKNVKYYSGAEKKTSTTKAKKKISR